MNIIYLEGKEELLVYVKPLWENTRDYHSRISTYFRQNFLHRVLNREKVVETNESRI